MSFKSSAILPPMRRLAEMAGTVTVAVTVSLSEVLGVEVKLDLVRPLRWEAWGRLGEDLSDGFGILRAPNAVERACLRRVVR